MREIERNCKGTSFVVEINKEEKNLLEAFEELRKTDKEASLLLINPETYFGYNLEKGVAITLEFKELDHREY